jgi:Excalibur calcium-binding domain
VWRNARPASYSRRLTGTRAAIARGVKGSLLVGVLSAALIAASTSSAVIPPLYKNCTALNKRYPHGVGRTRARDKTSGTPVTTFRRSDLLYRRAMSYNRGLDRDKDGIACEKV